MGYSLVFGRSYSPVLDLRPSGEQSKGMCSKYGPLYGIGSTSQEFEKVEIGEELTPSSHFQGQAISILSGSS